MQPCNASNPSLRVCIKNDRRGQTFASTTDSYHWQKRSSTTDSHHATCHHATMPPCPQTFGGETNLPYMLMFPWRKDAAPQDFQRRYEVVHPTYRANHCELLRRSFVKLLGPHPTDIPPVFIRFIRPLKRDMYCPRFCIHWQKQFFLVSWLNQGFIRRARQT